MGRRIDPPAREPAARRKRQAGISARGNVAFGRGEPEGDDRAHLDAALDEALAETFPASDPIAIHRPDPP